MLTEVMITNCGEVTIFGSGTDCYARALIGLRAGGRDAGEVLVGAVLARPYDGVRREGWCA